MAGWGSTASTHPTILQRASPPGHHEVVVSRKREREVIVGRPLRCPAYCSGNIALLCCRSGRSATSRLACLRHGGRKRCCLLAAVERAVQAGAYAAGFLAYEAAAGLDEAFCTHDCPQLPLAWFGLFRSMYSQEGDCPIFVSTKMGLSPLKHTFASAIGGRRSTSPSMNGPSTASRTISRGYLPGQLHFSTSGRLRGRSLAAVSPPLPGSRPSMRPISTPGDTCMLGLAGVVFSARRGRACSPGR